MLSMGFDCVGMLASAVPAAVLSAILSAMIQIMFVGRLKGLYVLVKVFCQSPVRKADASGFINFDEQLRGEE